MKIVILVFLTLSKIYLGYPILILEMFLTFFHKLINIVKIKTAFKK